ncbi:MAG: hypothetical protein ABFR05_04085 [Bacteroidota bacterium]
MKNIFIIALFIFYITGSFSQSEMFTFDNIVKGEERSKDAIITGSYVILEANGTVKELYQLTKGWINKTYNGTTKEGIISGPDSNYLKVQGYRENLIYRSYKGKKYSCDSKYIMSFKFEENQIKVELNNLSVNPEYSNGRWRELGSIQIVKINGRPNTEGLNEIEALKNYFNPLMKSLKDHISL